MNATASAIAGSKTRLLRGLWRLADPKISLASLASMFLGTTAAARDGPLSAPWLAVTGLGILLLEAAKNASGEIFDFDSGTDLAVRPEERTPFSGGKRVLVESILTRRETAAIAAAGYALAGAAGLAIACFREPAVLWLGLAGFAAAWFYHAPPLRLSHRGLGELAVGLSYGPLLCAGAYLVQRHEVPPAVAALSLPLGLGIASFLWINEFPDWRADLASGKRTLVVRLGRRKASRVFAAMVGAAFAILALLPVLGLPRSVWFGAGALPPLAYASVRLLAHPESAERLPPAQAATLAGFVLLAIGSGLGLLLD